MRLACFVAVAVTIAQSFAIADDSLRPMPEAELAKRSTLVLVADVLGVARLRAEQGSAPRYSAWIQVVRVEKGATAPSETIQVDWTAADPARLGSWSADLFPGDRVRLFLEPVDPANKGAGPWHVFHSSGTEVVRKAPKETRKLPDRPGAVTLRAASMPEPPDLGGPADPKTTPTAPEGVPQ